MAQRFQTADVRLWVVERAEAPAFRLEHSAELRRPGLYILASGDRRVYVGEGYLFRRLRRQTKRRDFWERAAVIVSRSGRLNAGHTAWLEARLIELLRDQGRYELDNYARAQSTLPALPYLHEIDLAIVARFLAGVQRALNRAGVVAV